MNRSEQADTDHHQPRNLEEWIERLDGSSERKDSVSVGEMMKAVGERSFGPLILLLGLIALSPLSGIPTVPTIVGIMVIVLSAQLLMGRSHFWLPQKLLGRTIARKKLVKALNAMKPAGRFVDKWVRPRLSFITGKVGTLASAAFCLMIGLTMPPLELVPFLATTAGVALSMFGLSLIARDGVLMIAALCVSGVTFFIAARQMLI
jgi:hypothetical protein